MASLLERYRQLLGEGIDEVKSTLSSSFKTWNARPKNVIAKRIYSNTAGLVKDPTVRQNVSNFTQRNVTQPLIRGGASVQTSPLFQKTLAPLSEQFAFSVESATKKILANRNPQLATALWNQPSKYLNTQQINQRYGTPQDTLKTTYNAGKNAMGAVTAIANPAIGAQALLLGTAPKIVSNIAQKQKITKDLGDTAIESIGNAAILKFTNMATDKLLAGLSASKLLSPATRNIADKLTPERLNAPYQFAKQTANNTLKNKMFIEGTKRQLMRALAEVPVESLAFGTETAIRDKESWAKSVVEGIPNNIIGNLAFAGLATGMQGTNIYKKQFSEALSKAIKNNLTGKEAGFIKPDEFLPKGKVSKGVIPEVGGVSNVKPQTVGVKPMGEEVTKDTQDTQNRTMGLVGQETKATMPLEKQITNKGQQAGSSKAIIPPNNVTPESIKATLPQRVNNFIQDTLGYSTKEPVGGTRSANLWTKTLRKGQEAITTKVESGLGSESKLVRTAATTLQNFFRGAGMSPERAAASMELRGGIGVARNRAYDVMQTLYNALGNDKESLARINAVLDPPLAKTAITFEQLTPKEQQVYSLLRGGLDLVHDTSFANGHISQELYQANKGKYVPRLYQPMELPPEINKFVTQGKKIVNDLYKQRSEVTDWKLENSLNDPVYGLGKRLAQVETNAAIKKYTDFLASKPNLVSDVERGGFTKLSDSKAYGALSGKYVLNSAAEDLKGFFFANEATQNLYDVFRAYDRMPIRQLQKKLLTVFNPTTNVGNIVSDQVFGFVTGVDPLTLNKNLVDFKQNPAKYKQLSDYLMKKGIVGTDITKTDFVNRMGQIDTLAKEVGQNVSGAKKIINKVGKVTEKVQSFYGGTDDVYKTSAFKALLDKGYSLEEATRKVADGFQNYANVGKFYDVWAKTPVIGSAFVKFQGDLIRIIKNGAVNNPLGLITFLGTLEAISLLSSKLSGETPEDYKTRTERFSAPMIPGLNVPLTWQTPIGEINVARYISPFFANNDTTSLAKMLPFVPTIDPKKDVASNIAINTNDPLLSTPIQLLVNRDFRGKPISDPKENKYQPSTLTPQEKLINQAKFAGGNYLPPTVNSLVDVKNAVQGNPNRYGSMQTPAQAVARVAGVKISQFGAKEAEQSRQKDLEYDQKGNDYLDQQIRSIYTQQLNGKVTPEQAKSRIDNLMKQKSTTNLFPQQTQPTPTAAKTTGDVSDADYSTRIIQSTIDGSFIALLDKKNNLTRSYDTYEEARQAIIKNEFKKSGKNILVSGDTVYRITKGGDVSTTTKDEYDLSLYEAKMTNAKKDEDINTWLKVAETKFETLQKQLEDPDVDELDKITIQNKMDTLVAEYAKYKSYGGFTKPKKAKKVTLKKIKTPKLKLGGSKKVRKLAKVTVKKIKAPSTKLVVSKVKKVSPYRRFT